MQRDTTSSLVVIGDRTFITRDACFRITVEQCHKLAGLWERQGTKENRVEKREDGQIGTNTDAQNQQSRYCEALLSHESQTEPWDANTESVVTKFHQSRRS